MSSWYTEGGKRKSSMTHANRSWTCPCGQTVWGNGGKSSHQRACLTWARKALQIAENMLALASDPDSALGRSILIADQRAKYTAERDRWRQKLDLPAEGATGD